MNTDKTTVTGEGNALRIPQGKTYRTLIENGEETDLLCRKCECLYWQCEHQSEIEKEYDALKNAPRTVTLAKGGTGERVVEVNRIEIPDLWHIAQSLPAVECEAVLKVWHLAHDLRRELQEL